MALRKFLMLSFQWAKNNFTLSLPETCPYYFSVDISANILVCMKQSLFPVVSYVNACKIVCGNLYACAGMGEVWEGTRGHNWGTCYVNRCVCSFIEGEVKAEAGSCSCLEDLIYANNKREEVKSRNWTCATVAWLLQSATHVSQTVHIINICTCEMRQLYFHFSAPFLLSGLYLWQKQNTHSAKCSPFDLIQMLHELIHILTQQPTGLVGF